MNTHTVLLIVAQNMPLRADTLEATVLLSSLCSEFRRVWRPPARLPRIQSQPS